MWAYFNMAPNWPSIVILMGRPLNPKETKELVSYYNDHGRLKQVPQKLPYFDVRKLYHISYEAAAKLEDIAGASCKPIDVAIDGVCLHPLMQVRRVDVNGMDELTDLLREVIEAVNC